MLNHQKTGRGRRRLLLKALACAAAFVLLMAGACAAAARAQDSDFPALSDFKIKGHSHEDPDGVYWLAGDAVAEVKAPDGYTISTDADGTYSASVWINRGESRTVYLKREDGAQTGAIDLSDVLKWDVVPPTGEMRMTYQLAWTDLRRVAFGLFLKGGKTATVKPGDSGSGVASIRYYIASGGELAAEGADTADILPALNALDPDAWNAWSPYDPAISLPVRGKCVVYAKLTDNVGNVSYINSDSITFYEDSALAQGQPDSLAYTRYSGMDTWVQIQLNSNAVNEVSLDGQPLTLEEDYTLDMTGDTAMIVLKADKLDALTDGEHSLSVSIHPLGVTNTEGSRYSEKPLDIEAALKIFPHTASWGEAHTRPDGVTQYTTPDGMTSAELKKENLDESGVLWLKEEAGGKTVWYGIDLSNSALPLDRHMRVTARCLTEQDGDYDVFQNIIDEANRTIAKSGSLFHIGILGNDGSGMAPQDPLGVYVQLDDDWNPADVRAFCALAGEDEFVHVDRVERSYPGGTDMFARLELNTFLPHFIFEKLSAALDLPRTGDESRLGLWLALLALCAAGARMRRRA